MADPRIFLANFSSLRKADPAIVGTGRRWTAMAKPRRWEYGEGYVSDLAPEAHLLDLAKSGLMTADEYFRQYRQKIEGRCGRLRPGALQAGGANFDVGGGWVDVSDGDFIGCACARDAALAGLCHLAHAAPYLARAGWDVCLHGRRVRPDGTVEPVAGEVGTC